MHTQMKSNTYPTEKHAKAASKFVELFSGEKRITAILLVGSCARGMATPDSCLDLTIMIDDAGDAEVFEKHVESVWNSVDESAELRRAGRFSNLDLNFTDGKFRPGRRGWTSGPDSFEIEIGNTYVYSVPLFVRDGTFEERGRAFLPYYNDELRKERLADIGKYFYNNLDHIPLYVRRGLHFQSLERLINASREYLQALFVYRRIYPISYDKWIRLQLVDILGRPDIYSEFVEMFRIEKVDSNELIDKSIRLREMAERDLGFSDFE
jgi:predicted nucleotidyltransferase